MSNILEHLHQSWFFYLLPNHSKLIPISKYIQVIILCAASFLLSALYGWLKLKPNVPHEQYATKVEFIPKTFGFSIITVLSCYVFSGFILFAVICTRSMVNHLDLALFITVCIGSLAFPILYSISFGRFCLAQEETVSDWVTLKAILDGLTGISLLLLSWMHFSLAMVMGFLVCIPYLSIEQNKSLISRSIKFILVTLVSPTVLAAAFSWYLHESFDHIISSLMTSYHQLDWKLYIIVFIYWPLNFGYQILSLLKEQKIKTD